MPGASPGTNRLPRDTPRSTTALPSRARCPARSSLCWLPPAIAVIVGQPVAVVEAMKMEHTLRAGTDGVVSDLVVQVR